MISPVFIALGLLDVLALWAIIYGRGKWAIKVAAIVVALAFNFTVYSSWGTGRGWPTPDDPPSRAQFVGCLVEEPDVVAQQVGAIYLWLIPLDSGRINPLDYKPNVGEPRAYRLPYSRELHLQCVAAKKAAGSGTQVGVVRSPGHRGHGHPQGGRPIPKWAFRLYVLPPPRPPVKPGR